MNTERNCQFCKYYKDGYCENLELQPCYPSKGCGDFSKREALEQESCDAISRQAVLGILKDKWNMFSDANDAMQESIDTIEAFLPVTPQPKTGRWIPVSEMLPEINEEAYSNDAIVSLRKTIWDINKCQMVHITKIAYYDKKCYKFRWNIHGYRRMGVK